MPQAIKSTDDVTDAVPAEEEIFDNAELEKSDGKLSDDSRASSLTVLNQVPVTETPRESSNAFEIVQKPVKSVYIDKEVKLNMQQDSSGKVNEGAALESANISTIHMTEVQHQQQQQPQQQQQQTNFNNYSNAPKVARSSVVQQLLRKVPTTGPSTLQVSFDRLI